jgi:hypothetical protein
MGVQPKRCARNPRHDKPVVGRKHSHDHKGLGVEVPRSDAHNMPLIQPFQASVNTIKNTTEELHSVDTQYAVSNEVAQLHPTPSSSMEASPDVVI